MAEVQIVASLPNCLSEWSIAVASLYSFRISAHDVLYVPSVSLSLPARSTRAVNVSRETSMSANPAG